MKEETEREMATKITDAFIKNVMENSEAGDYVIRTGGAYTLREPAQVWIEATIEAPAERAEKRKEQVIPASSHVIANMDDMTVTLVINENDPYFTQIRGKLELSEQFQRMKINTGNYISSLDMAEHFKMNKALFANRTECMQLVTELRALKAKVKQTIEQADDKRGNTHMLREQAIELLNIPDIITLHIPLFKGASPVDLPIEIYVNPEDLTCTLVSSDATAMIDDQKADFISGVVARIVDVVPDIPVIIQ